MNYVHNFYQNVLIAKLNSNALTNWIAMNMLIKNYVI